MTWHLTNRLTWGSIDRWIFSVAGPRNVNQRQGILAWSGRSIYSRCIYCVGLHLTFPCVVSIVVESPVLALVIIPRYILITGLGWVTATRIPPSSFRRLGCSTSFCFETLQAQVAGLQVSPLYLFGFVRCSIHAWVAPCAYVKRHPKRGGRGKGDLQRTRDELEVPGRVVMETAQEGHLARAVHVSLPFFSGENCDKTVDSFLAVW